MDRDALVQQVQLNILKRYDVLLDCSDIDDRTLTKLSKRLPKVNGEHATFASWCDHVFGDHRPAVARFDRFVPGQLHIEKLRLGMREGLSRREKARVAHIKQLQNPISTLEAEQPTDRTDAQPPHDADQARWVNAWQRFYAGPRDMLQKLLDDVQDIEGPIREYQGEPNRTYRNVIAEGARSMLEQLANLGFDIDVTLATHEAVGLKTQSIAFFRTPAPQDNLDQLLSFEVQNMPTDILLSVPDAVSDKSTCRFTLYRGCAQRASPEEIQHLGAFLHKLLAALAKSANNVPRGGLRENLLLSLMLSWSAPGITFRASYLHLRSDSTVTTAQPQKQRTELSPLQIFQRFTTAITPF